jgi:DNA-binding response OmpR family regulator
MKRILVVEDNKLILETIAQSLSREGYEIIKAMDGKECLRLLDENNFDLLITDLYMPFINGLELLSMLQEQGRKTMPVLVLSAGGNEENVLKAFEMGADDFMIKPFSLSELNFRIKKLLMDKR